MRQLWVLEHTARSGLLISGLAVNAGLLCLLLGRWMKVPAVTYALVAAIAAAGLAVLFAFARAKAPSKALLARMLDERAGTEDLFASALEFAAQADRFGKLGEETCKLALAQAPAIRIATRWTLGARSRFVGIIGGAVVLGVAYASVSVMQGAGGKIDAPAAAGSKAPDQPVQIARIEEPAKPSQPPADKQPQLLPDTPTSQPEKKPDQAVAITNEMIDKYMSQMPAAPQDVDLTGVTPIRWDQEEVTGKNNDQGKTPDKIDPVKLDASLLKDLESAKKTKEEGGPKEGGVDIVVMGDQPGAKAKGKEGGKGGESLSDAVSKDPRGEPSRMAQRPEKKGFQIFSIVRLPTKQKGDDRPMSLLDILSAIEQMKSGTAGEMGIAAAPANSPPAENVVRQETVPQSGADLTEAYFGQLRKADR
jgi:hypothetical protein